MIARRAILRGACACAALAACGRRGGTDGADSAAGDSGAGDSAAGDSGAGDSGAGDSGAGDSGAAACVDTGGSVDGWVEIPLADHPALAKVGGWAVVDDDATLLHLLVAQPEPDCFVALWRICTHGACELDWDASAREAVCPCHGSVFAEDGAVVEGPATVAVRAFPIVRRGDSLWLER